MKKIILVAAAICFAALFQVALSQTNEAPEKTKLEQNKATVRGYLHEVVDKGNLAAFDNYFAADVRLNGFMDYKGIRQFLANSQALNRVAFPDLHLTIVEQTAEGDKVVTRMIFQGTHLGDYRGYAATGKSVKYSATAIDRVVNGKVVAMMHMVNRQELLQQIGATPPPAAN